MNLKNTFKSINPSFHFILRGFFKGKKTTTTKYNLKIFKLNYTLQDLEIASINPLGAQLNDFNRQKNALAAVNESNSCYNTSSPNTCHLVTGINMFKFALFLKKV